MERSGPVVRVGFGTLLGPEETPAVVGVFWGRFRLSGLTRLVPLWVWWVWWLGWGRGVVVC